MAEEHVGRLGSGIEIQVPALLFIGCVILHRSLNPSVLSKILAPKDIHALIPTTCDGSKRDFVNVIKIRDLEMGRLSCAIPVGPI